jgi:hypothetical protein
MIEGLAQAHRSPVGGGRWQPIAGAARSERLSPTATWVAVEPVKKPIVTNLDHPD